MKDNLYDAVIIGGGPNGLICAAYLSKAGLKTIVLDARHETGGGLSTEEFGGFRFNIHAIYHLMAEIMPAYHDFKLWEYNVKYIYPEVQCAYVFKDKKPVILYKDPKKTAEYLASISKSDGEKYLKMYADFKEMSEKVLIPLTYAAPLPPVDQFQAMQNAKDKAGKMVAEISEMNAMEVIDGYGFSDGAKTALLNLFTMWGISPFEALGYLFPLYVYRMTNVGLCMGGSHRLSSALCKVIISAGGELYERAEVVKVSMANGKACGVYLADGTEVKAKCVISTVDPHQTFLRFFDDGSISPDLKESAKRWKWEEASFFGMHMGLRNRPDYKAAEHSKDVNSALICFLGINNMETLLNHVKAIEGGQISEDVYGHVTCTSVFDPLSSPEGFHTARWESLVSYRDDWDKTKDEYAKKCLAKWKEYASNIDPVHTYIYPPTYIEKKIKNMVRGSFKHGAYIPLQMGYFRPNDQCSGVRTPVESFYVCGASTYPGGMIIGGPGYIGAQTIVDDFGVKKAWDEPAYLKKAREIGLME